MSGGTFDYKQYEIGYIADIIERTILNNGKEKEEKPYYDWKSTHYEEYPDEVIEKFKEGLEILRKAEVYAQRIDWLMAGDDGDETFLERLKEDLDKIKQQAK